MESTVRFALLGGLSARRTERSGAEVEIDLGGPQQRRLLAALLLSLDRPLPPGRLIELVWALDPPASARGSLQAYISNLRRALQPGRRAGEPSQAIALRSGGYQLLVDRSQIDVGGFEAAVERGARELADRRPVAAVAVLADALASWAPLLPELADVPFVRAEADRLEAKRRSAFEQLQHARIDLGAHHDAIADLRRAVAEDPRDERLWGLLALARYRAGQPAAAVDTIASARTALRVAGLELGPELRRLEADLYAQSPTLDLAASAVAPTGAPTGAPTTAPHGTRRRCRATGPIRRTSPGGAHLRRR